MRKILLLTVLFLAAGSYIMAGDVYDLQACIELAIDNDSSLSQASIDAENASRALENSWSLLLPSVNLQTGASYSDSLFNSGSSHGDPLSYSLGASLSLQLNRGIPVQFESLKISANLSEIAYETAKNQLISEVTGDFYSLLLARSEIELLREDLDLARKQLEKSETRFNNGLINERTLLQTRLQVETSKLSLSRSLSSYELDERSFLNILGLSGKEDVSFQGEIEPEKIDYEIDDLIARYLPGRTDLRTAALNVRLKELGIQSASSGRLPSVSLSGSLSGSTPDFSADSFSDSFSLGVSVSIPVDGWIPGSQDALDLRAAEGEVRKAELSLESAREEAELEVRNLSVSLDHAERSIEISKLQVEIAERSYQLAEEGFLRGTVERLELEETRTDLLEARLELLNGKYDYLKAEMDLMSALNIDDLSLLEK